MKLLIAIPTMDTVPVPFMQSLVGLVQRLDRDGVCYDSEMVELGMHQKECQLVECRRGVEEYDVAFFYQRQCLACGGDFQLAVRYYAFLEGGRAAVCVWSIVVDEPAPDALYRVARRKQRDIPVDCRRTYVEFFH